MERTSAGRREQTADVIAVVAVIVSLWAPTAVILGGPLAVGAGAGAVMLSTLAGIIDRDNGRAPVAFLIVLGIIAVALVLNWTIR